VPKKPKDVVQRILDYKQVFGTEAGKRVLWDMMGAAHMLHSSRIPGDNSGMETVFREGERNSVLRVLSIIDMDPEKLRHMIKEGRNQE
jgi:hypothetical protein